MRPARSFPFKLVVLCALATAFAVVSRGFADGAARQQQDLPPFKGVTMSGEVVPGLFTIRRTGVSTEPVRQAAVAFLAALTPEQRAETTYPVDDQEWRRWDNRHSPPRRGVSFEQMTAAQRESAYGLLRASLSAKGFEQSRNIMRLNGYLAEVLNRPGEYGEFLYHITVMGEPSATEPWGWQLDGHHLIINYFVLGDQVVMTPAFMGSEPVAVNDGAYAGTAVLQTEQDKGLAFMESLSPAQRRTATLEAAKPGNNALSQAGQDNLVLDYAGLRASELDSDARERLLDLIGEYIANMRDGHARVRMDEVRAHLNDTYFAWIGGIGPDAVFYYRIHSPVILVEFDHQRPVALPGERVPVRSHIHSVVRTPNGNDYGKDLLRQHYEAHRNDPEHGHSHD